MLLLFGIFYQFGFDTGRLEVEPYNHTQHYAERSDIEIENICASKLTKEEAIKCAIEAKTKPRNAKREEHDLGAQISMSRWAWWMILVTGVIGLMTVGVTAIGVWWVKRTLDATLIAAKAAQAATREAQTANTNAAFQLINQREFTQRELRAYVVASGAELDKKFKGGVSVQFTITNSGQTPAYNLETRKSIVFWPKGFTDMSPPSDEEMMLTDPIVLGPNGTVKGSISERLNAEELKKIERGELICLVFGHCTYWDIFDNTLRMETGSELPEDQKKEWFTRFCFKLDGFGTKKVRVVPFGEGNVAN